MHIGDVAWHDTDLPVAGLMDIISLKVSGYRITFRLFCTDGDDAQVYEAMAYHVTQANFNRRLKVVSAWSLQMTASAVISALSSIPSRRTSASCTSRGRTTRCFGRPTGP